MKVLLTTAAIAATSVGPAFAEVQAHEFKVVGTWGNLASWNDLELPFWTETLPGLSGGQLTGNAIPITEAGLKGGEVMRLLNLGVFEVAHGLGSYVAAENPAIEGMDLSSIASDFATMRAISDAYRPVMDESFQNTYGATILSMHPWPASMIYCRDPISSIADLAGRKVRVHSATLGDFIEGAGGTVVTLPFAEVVPALERGVADCAVTDPVSAYRASWQEVINHLFALPIGYSMTFSAINTDLWQGLDEDSRAIMTDAFRKLEEDGWSNAEKQQAMGVACLTGTSECTMGEPGSATLTLPTEADIATRQAILDNYVLPRWAERCGADCAAAWTETAGAAAGLAIVTN